MLFARVDEVREFASARLGLEPGESYTTYRRLDRDFVVEVVSAARSTSFERKEWWFPIVGSVPYRGYYRSAPAERLARRLNGQGWDVLVRRVEAFSTLGFFRDPLYSFMADYETGRLAELIIHESAHATLWVNGEAQFNEEFATFVGRAGAERFLSERYGEESGELVQWLARRRDQTRFREEVLALKERLAHWYEESAAVGREEAEILAGKDRLIGEAQAAFAATWRDRYETEVWAGFVDAEINNAWLDLFTTYSGNIERFEVLHAELGNDLAATVAEVRRRVAGWTRLPRRTRPPVIDLL